MFCHFIRLSCLIILLFSVFGCSRIQQYELSEQMVNHYLHTENGRQIRYKARQEKITVDMSLNDVKVDIGRSPDKDISASCTANLVLHFPHQEKYLTLKVQLSGKPELDLNNRAVYLNVIDVQDYQEANGKSNTDMKKITPSLVKMMKNYFKKYPIYLTDNSNSLEKAAFNGAAFSVEKGKLNFLL